MSTSGQTDQVGKKFQVFSALSQVTGPLSIIEVADSDTLDRKSVEDLLEKAKEQGALNKVVVVNAHNLTHADQRYLMKEKNLPEIVLVTNYKPSSLTRSPDKRPPDRGNICTRWMWTFFQASTPTPASSPIPSLKPPPPRKPRIGRRSRTPTAPSKPALAA